MAKWIKSWLKDMTKMLTVKMPGSSRAGMTKLQRCSNKSTVVQRGSPGVFSNHKDSFTRGSHTEARKRKLTGLGNQSILSLLGYRGLANLGNLSVLQPFSSTRARARSSLFGINFRSSYREPWMMSDEEVMDMITKNECVGRLQHGLVSIYESNLLPSNDPTEDRRFVSRLLHDREALLFGVLDGHGGDVCAHNVAQRLSDYIGASLLPSEILLGSTLKNYLCAKHFLVINAPNKYNFREDPICYENLKRFFMELRRVQKRLHTSDSVAPTLAHLQETHAHQTAAPEAKEEQVFYTMAAMSKAFLRLDDDLSHEALAQTENKVANEQKFKAATAGACALVVYLKGTELTVANCGDCRAVLGVQSEDGQWSALQLSTDHTARNPSEVQRVLSEHPSDEASTCLKHERLLGRLAPLRAFGDAKFKWSKKKQEKLFHERGLKPLSDAKEFHTPPYLTAEPEVTSYQLQRSDKFLILATDGLWDMLSNEEAVDFVRDNLEKHPPGYSITYREQKSTSTLENSASRLIKEALGGEDHVAVSTSLSIPYPDVRMYRDDITVTVVHFDWSNVSVE